MESNSVLLTVDDAVLCLFVLLYFCASFVCSFCCCFVSLLVCFWKL